jgi:glycosyltransferase involved in cell wall biosynthesis
MENEKDPINKVYNTIYFVNSNFVPKISVLLPVWKLDEFFSFAIHSLIAQTFSDFEVLILSSAEELERIESSFSKILDNRFRFVATPQDWPLGKVLNFGIRHSRGELIARADSDDISLPARFEEQIKFLDENPDVSLVGSWGEIFGSEEWIFSPPSKHSEIFVELFFGNIIMHPSVMFRKDFLYSHDLFYSEELRGTEDYELWSRWVLVGRLANIPKILVKYRKHSSAATPRNQDETNRIAKSVMESLFHTLVGQVSQSEINNHYELCNNRVNSIGEVLAEHEFLTKISKVNMTQSLLDKGYFDEYTKARTVRLLSQLVVSKGIPRKLQSPSAQFLRKIFLSNRYPIPAIRRVLKNFARLFISLVSHRSLFQFSKSSINVEDARSAIKSILFFVGCPEGESERYRVDNICEYLSEIGIGYVKIYEGDLPIDVSRFSFDLVVIFRTRLTQEVHKFIVGIRRLGVPLIFDVDDLVFEPSSVDFVGAMRQLGLEQRPFHFKEAQLQRRTLLMCNAATASTSLLVKKIKQLGIPSQLVPNSVNSIQIKTASVLNGSEKVPWVGIRLGFFSGSPTHQRDFETISDSLATFMSENRNVKLVIVGFLDIPPAFASLHAQIEFHDFCDYTKMLFLLSHLDALLVPLEYGNPFTAAKSELKIFEPALVKVPAIVANVGSYGETISHGHNGFLVDCDGDWLWLLRKFCLDKELLAKIGENAHLDFGKTFHYRNSGRTAVEFYQSVLDRFHEGLDFEGRLEN